MLADGDPRHGTMNGYHNLLCRCQPCKDAWAAYCLRKRRARADREPPTHGRNTYLNWACRCEVCRQAARDVYSASRKDESRPA